MTPELMTTEQIQQRAVKALTNVLARNRKAELDRAWWLGVQARGRYMRVSPFYEDLGADTFWFAGYDGLSLEEAAIVHDGEFAAVKDSVLAFCR